MFDVVEPTSSVNYSIVTPHTPTAVTFLKFFLPLLLIVSMWAWATPIDGSPDEHRHLILGYALASGQVTGSSTTYQVPVHVGINRSACYAFFPEESAACDRLYREDATEAISTATSANNYPRLYYRIAGAPLAWFPTDLGVQLARMLGAAISCSLLALGFVCARRLRTPWLTLGLLLATTPMVFFLMGSFNPHGLELAGCAAFMASLLAILVNPQRAGGLAHVTSVIALPAMVLSRPNGFVWPVVLTILIMMAAKNPRWALSRLSRPYRWWLSTVAGVTILYAIWWQVTRGSRDTGAGVIGPIADRFDSPSGVLLQMLTKAQTFPGDWIGTFGWLDTRVTSATLLLWFGIAGGLVLIGLTLRPGRQLWVAGASLAAAIVFTTVVDLYYRSSLGVTVAQGRYVLPFAMLAICLVTLNMSGIEVVQERLPGILAVTWFIGSSVAMFESMRRYTVGVSLRSSSGSWDPPAPAALLLLLAGGAMIYLAHAAANRVTQ